MSYKSEFASNNADLQTVLDMVNALPDAITPETPAISITNGGLIEATANDLSATLQLTTQAAKTITPGTSSQTAVASGRYTTGAVTVAGDSDLKAANIKSGVNIFGVSGTYKGASPVLQEDDSVVTLEQDPSDELAFTITIPYAMSKLICFVLAIEDPLDVTTIISLYGYVSPTDETKVIISKNTASSVWTTSGTITYNTNSVEIYTRLAKYSDTVYNPAPSVWEECGFICYVE